MQQDLLKRIVLSLLAAVAWQVAAVAQTADLSVSKSGPAGPVTAGDPVTYTITVTNNGPDEAVDVVATDTLPDEDGTPPGELEALETAGCTEDPGGLPDCSLGTISVGESVEYTIEGTVKDDALTTDSCGPDDEMCLINSVSVTSETAEASSGDETDTAETLLQIIAELELQKSVSPDPVFNDEPVTYTLTLTNHGPAQGFGVKVEDTLPLPFTHTGNDCGVSYAPPGPLEWVINDMPPGTTLTCNIEGTFHSGFTGEATNTASVSAISFVTDPDPDNDSVDLPVTVLDPTFRSDIVGTKEAGGDLARGGTVVYTVVLSNLGPGLQQDNPEDEFVDVLPPELALVSATADAGLATADPGTNTVTWNGEIPAGETVTITIEATIPEDTPIETPITNQGTIHHDADGDGSNEATRLTDDPAEPDAEDPTVFLVGAASVLEIPTLGEWALWLLALTLAGLGMGRLRG